MKFTFTRKRNEDEDYSSFNGDDSYYNFGENADDTVSEEDDGFGMSGFGAEDDELAATAAPFGGSTASVALKIVNPKGYDEAPTIADFLLNGNTVLLNIEGLDKMSALRLLNYLAGELYVLVELILGSIDHNGCEAGLKSLNNFVVLFSVVKVDSNGKVKVI